MLSTVFSNSAIFFIILSCSSFASLISFSVRRGSEPQMVSIIWVLLFRCWLPYRKELTKEQRAQRLSNAVEIHGDFGVICHCVHLFHDPNHLGWTITTGFLQIKNTSLKNFYTKSNEGKPNKAPLSYDNAGVYTSILQDAFLDYKNIYKDIRFVEADVDSKTKKLEKSIFNGMSSQIL